VNTKGEKLAKVARRFKTAKAVLELHIGDTLLCQRDAWVHSKGCSHIQKMLYGEQWEIVCIIYLDSDRLKFGSIFRNFKQQNHLVMTSICKHSRGEQCVSNHRLWQTKRREKENQQEFYKNKYDAETQKLSFSQIRGQCEQPQYQAIATTQQYQIESSI